jgi:hypothetical protein
MDGIPKAHVRAYGVKTAHGSNVPCSFASESNPSSFYFRLQHANHSILHFPLQIFQTFWPLGPEKGILA